MILWTDIETTGLSVASDFILEIAVLATDENLNETFDPLHLMFRPSGGMWEQLRRNPEVVTMHAKSGLLVDLFSEEPDARLMVDPNFAAADEALCDFLNEAVIALMEDHDEKIRLGGSGVDRFDMLFLQKWFQNFADRMHYISVDISPFREFARVCGLDKPSYTSPSGRTHRALDDVLDELAEARAWRDLLMTPK